MTPQFDQLTTQALSLTEDERLVLAHRLWESVRGNGADLEVDEELIAEIERRDAEMEAGTVETFTHEEVMEAARKAIKRR